uniref:RING-type domain-containing protein n=1 Tax=Oryza meridionalis TaxID=40149 RepID=A0A0E0EHW5_9ORYZ
MTGAAAWPVCTICYEDLRPLSDQHLHCLPACGHVFHALCVEQWLEYCPGGKKKLTCPICKQPCGAAHPPTRLFFQSTGACPTQSASSSPSRQEPTDGGADREELAAEVARLEQKAASLGRVAMWREKAGAAEVMKESVRREKECVQHLLNAKTEELSRKTSECGRLQEKCLALAKELAALKLSTDMNLQEEEILKLASLGNHGNAENAVDVLTRSLALRNKSYKELMIQCNVLGRSESRSQQRFEKAKELIKKLKDPCDKPGPSPEAKSDLNIKDKMDDKHADVIDLDADDSVFQHEHKKGLSAKPFGNDGNNLDFQSRSSLQERYRKESIPCKTSFVAEENSFLKHSMVTERSALQESLTTNKLQSFQETPVLRSMKSTTSTWEKETLTIDGISKQATRMAPGTGPQQVHNFNSLSDDFQIPIRNLGGEGTGKSVGKWCKGVATPASLNTNANKRNLIAVGPDRRGGKVKILRDLGKFQDSKTQALWPKAQKVGSRGGQSQIDHFFGKR